jgi:F-type H+-transporting ATPase subunit b
MEILKLLSANEIVAQIVCFLILLVLLRKFAWTPVLKMLDDRRERIAAELKNIEDTKAGVAKVKADYEHHLTNIEAEARQRVKEAVEEGKKLQDQMRKTAYQESQKILDEARWAIEHELAETKESLKNRIVDLTVEATKHLILEKLDEAGDKKLVQDFLDKIETLEQ